MGYLIPPCSTIPGIFSGLSSHGTRKLGNLFPAKVKFWFEKPNKTLERNVYPLNTNAAMATLGIFNVQTGSLEGADDPPAGIFRMKGNVVGQIVAILSVLSLQVQGCQSKDNDSLGELTPSLVIFTMVLGLAVLLFCRLLGPPHPVAEMLSEPNTTTNEQASSSSAVPDDATHQLAYAVPRSSTDLPTPESFVRWLIMRCQRRLENTNLDLSRRNTYLERIDILRSLQNALENPLFRASAMRNMAEMADISDDEESPTNRGGEPVSLGDAQRAHNFFMFLRGRTAGNTHVDSVADALMQNESDEDSDERMETASETQRRYYQSTQDEVSDPDLWAMLHYGEYTDGEEAEED